MTADVAGAREQLDQSVIAAADAVEEEMRADLMRLVGRQAAVVAAAPAGPARAISSPRLSAGSGLRVCGSRWLLRRMTRCRVWSSG